MNELIEYICDGVQYNASDKEYIIVTLTSWTKRINNVATVIQSILSGNVIPDKININLAIPEFPNKEKDLPEDLIKLINNNSIIEINWLSNNTTVWKKSIPTMYKYPNAYILCIDDDLLYPKDFVESFVKLHSTNKNKYIVGYQWKNHGVNQHCGCSTLDCLQLIKPRVEQLTKQIYDIGDEDTFFTVCYLKSNIWSIQTPNVYWLNLKSLSTNDSYSSKHRIIPTRNYTIISDIIK